MKKTLLTLLLLSSFSFTNAQSTVGLIAHWDMNGSTNDVSSGGHNGTGVNITATAGIDGTPNTAYLFNGTNSRIDIPNSTAFNITKYSICAIVRVDGFYHGTCQGNTIFTRGAGLSHTPGSYCLAFDDNQYDSSCSHVDTVHNVFFGGARLVPSFYAQSYYTPPIAVNNWYKVVVVMNDTVFKTFINGELKATAVISNPTAVIGTSSDAACIGYSLASAGAGYPYPFKGAIDDIMFYDRALTDSEAVHYGDTCGRFTSNPVSVNSYIGGSVTFTASSSIVSGSYQWQENSGSGFSDIVAGAPYSGANTGTLTINPVNSSLNGNYYRCISRSDLGCSDTSDTASLLTTMDVAHLTVNNPITISPNPTHNLLNIQVLVDNAEIQLFSFDGKLCISRSADSHSVVLDISSFPVGMYIVKATTNGRSYYQKVIKN